MTFCSFISRIFLIKFTDRCRCQCKLILNLSTVLSHNSELPQHFFTALFTNMRVLKCKTQLTIALFAAVNHLNGPLRKQNFTLTGSKGHGFWFVIGGFRSVLCFCVSRFVACDRNYEWRQRKTQLCRRLLNFKVRMFVKSAVNIYSYKKIETEICDIS